MPTTILQISQSCEGESDLIGLPAIAATTPPFPSNAVTGNVLLGGMAETPGLQTKQG